MLRAVRDGRLVRLGRHAVELLGNTSVTNEEAVQRLMAEAQATQGQQYIADLRTELIPPRFSGAPAASCAHVFDPMLSPQALTEVRRPGGAAPEEGPRYEAVARQV